MTTQVKLFFTTKGHKQLQEEINEWLQEADKKGHLIDSIQFQDSDGNEQYEASTLVLVRYREV